LVSARQQRSGIQLWGSRLEGRAPTYRPSISTSHLLGVRLMKTKFHIVLGLIVHVSLLAASAAQEPLAGKDKASRTEPGKRNAGQTAPTWTLEEAMAQLKLYPRDAYLQYVALQLARRDNRIDEISREIAQMIGNEEQAQRMERASRVDLFTIFTGALAVQESLQLDTMRGDTSRRA